MGWSARLSHYRPLHVSSRPGGKAKTLSHNFIQALKTHSSLGGALCHQTPSIKQTTYEVGDPVEHGDMVICLVTEGPSVRAPTRCHSWRLPWQVVRFHHGGGSNHLLLRNGDGWELTICPTSSHEHTSPTL